MINAGDGQHEHPTQALLDAATIRRLTRPRRAPASPDAPRAAQPLSIEGLEVAIVGDIAHSRVARSNMLCLAKLGARIRLVAPLTLIPRGIEQIGGEVTRERVRVVTRLEDGLDGVDVVMMLRDPARAVRRRGAAVPQHARAVAHVRAVASARSRSPSRTRSSCTPGRSTAASSSRRRSPTGRAR